MTSVDDRRRTWRLTEDQKHALARRYAAGEKVDALAAEYGVTASGVCMLVRKRVRPYPRRPANRREKL